MRPFQGRRPPDLRGPGSGGLLFCAFVAAGASGCYDDYLYPDPHHHDHHMAPAALAYGPPPPQTVTSAPPPPRYEQPLGCPYPQSYVPGQWTWNGAAWYWRNGFCAQMPSGYVYAPPVYSGGVYHHEHWAPAHHEVDHHDEDHDGHH